MATDPYREFRQAVDRPEETIDLGRAALTIALADYPDLDIGKYLQRIDDLAGEAKQRSGADGEVFRSIAALNFVLFMQHGFSGNRDQYYDAKNSFLNEVIESKRGLPIALSVLYMEVARRIGLVVDGIGFPGHFLVKTRSETDDEIIIDPFNAGDIKSLDDLQALLDRLYGGKVRFHRDFLAPLPKKQILKRMLINLKMIYGRADEWLKTLAVLDHAIILDAAAADEIRDRGAVYLRLECYGQAKEDFETYLRLAPDASDVDAVRERLVDLAKHSVLIH